MTTFEYLPGAEGDLMVALLGGFGLFWGNALLSVPRASQRLVAFLALHGEMVRRSAIAGSLWPDASEHHACTNLRQALARLQCTARKALAASKLELGLAEGVTVDVRHARALACRLLDPAVTPEQSDLGSAAVGTLSAELLPDWDDDWVLLEAEDWRQLRLCMPWRRWPAAWQPLAAAVRPPALPVRRCGRTHSGRAPEPASSRCTWLRATSRRQYASSHATRRCCMSTLALSPPPGCAT